MTKVLTLMEGKIARLIHTLSEYSYRSVVELIPVMPKVNGIDYANRA